MDQFGQNPFSPGMRSSLFVPDQLIAGPLQLITDTVTVTGGAFKRGTVLGMVTESGKYTACVKTATDGSETPVAILVDNVDASTTDQAGGVYLMGEFNQNRIITDDSWTLASMKSALRPLAIFLKDSIQAPVSAS
ncbi:head decoration protein [Symbiopectobacterium purcellii]|uniref:Head decoration protein n=1 Tax=Symbiopectobacterium purcellii TaxID=2871826 RepID=A0ABX9AU91_9ENTR|nr:head decoration protein [Symbiopectobacterium purcellii]QZN97350.1 head decoration protein [Symbiopectobacterium purcellii]